MAEKWSEWGGTPQRSTTCETFKCFCENKIDRFLFFELFQTTCDSTDGWPCKSRTSSNVDWFVKRWNHDMWKLPTRLRSKSSPTIKRPLIHFSVAASFTEMTIASCRLNFGWNTHEKAEKVIWAKKKKTNTCQKFTNSLLLNFVMTKDLRRLFEFRCCATSKTFAFMNEVSRSITPRKTIERIKNERANVNGDYRLVETRFCIKIRAICRSIELVVE